MPTPPTAPPISPPRTDNNAPALADARGATLLRAEARGKQVLLYTPDGSLGGLFVCSHCGASAFQPDLLDHPVDCPYRCAAGGGGR